MIFLAFIALNIQWFMLGGCFLTFLETGKEKGMTFEYYYLSRIWPDLDKRKVKVVSFYILPGLLMIITYVVQIWLGWKPLVRF